MMIILESWILKQGKKKGKNRETYRLHRKESGLNYWDCRRTNLKLKLLYLTPLKLYSRLVHTDILNLLPLMLHEDRAIATKLARKKATPLQSAKKLAIKLNKGIITRRGLDEASK
ncbi:hypothetical protein TorRG33x02_143410 [Trema orientale]|uniref:Ribosomal protein n=1 Tax=Trema orientale TaxID=63057 RepID=A0A2P5EWA4_TREOI|nr:hypothetical protein TorRG33x02_143410 [Trema orientale]